LRIFREQKRKRASRIPDLALGQKVAGFSKEISVLERELSPFKYTVFAIFSQTGKRKFAS
jgi:hypothetical protein